MTTSETFIYEATENDCFIAIFLIPITINVIVLNIKIVIITYPMEIKRSFGVRALYKNRKKSEKYTIANIVNLIISRFDNIVEDRLQMSKRIGNSSEIKIMANT